MDLSLSEAEGPALPALSEAEGLEVEESEADVAYQDRRLDSRRGV